MRHESLSRMREDLAEPENTRRLNRDLFTMIAAKYNYGNRFLSIGRDGIWKDVLVARLPKLSAPVCLDLACGTGDLARRLAGKYPDGAITGLDLTEAMLAEARLLGQPANLSYVAGDMGRTGFPDNSVDIVTGGYALRNAGDLKEVLREVHRILKPGGIAVFLDFSKSEYPVFQSMSSFVLKLWGGLWGWVLYRDPRVYIYIAESLARYPDRRRLACMFNEAGFSNLQTWHAFLGLIECLTAEKRQ